MNPKPVNSDAFWKPGQPVPQQRYPGKTIGNTDILPKVVKPTLQAVKSGGSRENELSPLRESNAGIKQLVQSIKKEGSQIDFQEVDRKMEGIDFDFAINNKYVNKLLDISMHGS